MYDAKFKDFWLQDKAGNILNDPAHPGQFSPCPNNLSTLVQDQYFTDFRKPTLFTVSHYAGDVTYTCDAFLEKSVENVSLQLIQAAKASSKPLVQSLFTAQSSRRSVVSTKAGSRRPTVGLKFTKQLAGLIEARGSTLLKSMTMCLRVKAALKHR